MASAHGGGLRSGPEFNLAVHVAEGVVDTRNNRSQPCVYLLSVLPECGRELPHLCRSGDDRCMRLDDGERRVQPAPGPVGSSCSTQQPSCTAAGFRTDIRDWPSR